MIYFLIWMHFLADFVFQSDQMALQKSKSWKWLTYHIFAYSFVLSLTYLLPWKFILVNAAAHFVTDAVTSRVTSYLWKREMRHWFFVAIGWDQAAHLSVLVWSAEYFNLL